MDTKEKNSAAISAIKSINLKDAGSKERDFGCCVESRPKKAEKTRIVYPTLYLNAKNAPDLVGYDVDDEVTIIIKGKIVGHNINDRKDSEKRENFDVEIKKIGCAVKEK